LRNSNTRRRTWLQAALASLTLLPWWLPPAGRPDGLPAMGPRMTVLRDQFGPLHIRRDVERDGRIVERAMGFFQTRSWYRPVFPAVGLRDQCTVYLDDPVNRSVFRGGFPGEWSVSSFTVHTPEDPRDGDWVVDWTLRWRRGGWRDWPGGRPVPAIDFEALGLK
jgi:hypothetical protein